MRDCLIGNGLEDWTLTLALDEGDFKEEQHPRDETGKFSLGKGESTEEAFKHPTTGEYAPKRSQRHQAIVDKIVAGKKSSGAPTAYIMGGGSASGKSTGFKKKFARKMRMALAHIDSDAIKNHLPEYERLKQIDPEKAAYRVHEESSHIAKKALAAAIAGKLDLVYDSTGAGGGTQDMAKRLKGEGYKVHVVYFDIPIPEAKVRAGKRAEKTGRHIPEHVIQGSHKGSAKNFMEMTKGGHIDKMSLYDTTERVPTLVYSKEGSRPGMIMEGEKWKEYMKKAGVEENQK
jgi:predicted ABC-type ATPase